MEPAPTTERKGDWRQSVWEVIKFVAITLAIVVPIRTWIAQPFIVSGASMEPTFDDREYLIIDELTYQFRPPERSEVVVFRYPKDPSKFFIKRIIGLPGETLRLKDNEVALKDAATGEWREIEEPYLASGEATSLWASQEVTLAPDEYFVLGDNRAVSSDSRYWGALPRQLITGRALVRLLPPRRVALWPGAI